MYYPKTLIYSVMLHASTKITITSNVSEIMWDVNVRVTRSWGRMPRSVICFTLQRQVLECCQSRCCSEHVSAHSLVSHNFFWGTTTGTYQVEEEQAVSTVLLRVVMVLPGEVLDSSTFGCTCGEGKGFAQIKEKSLVFHTKYKT